MMPGLENEARQPADAVLDGASQALGRLSLKERAKSQPETKRLASPLCVGGGTLDITAHAPGFQANVCQFGERPFCT